MESESGTEHAYRVCTWGERRATVAHKSGRPHTDRTH